MAVTILFDLFIEIKNHTVLSYHAIRVTYESTRNLLPT